MVNMIEKVAKAIAVEQDLSNDYAEVIMDDLKGMARAAIEAMREPTEGMTKAAIGYGIPLSGMYEGSEEDFVEDVYEAMIDKALEEDTDD